MVDAVIYIMAATIIVAINLQFYFLPDALMKNESISITNNIYAGMGFEDRTKPQVRPRWEMYGGPIYALTERPALCAGVRIQDWKLFRTTHTKIPFRGKQN